MNQNVDEICALACRISLNGIIFAVITCLVGIVPFGANAACAK